MHVGLHTGPHRLYSIPAGQGSGVATVMAVVVVTAGGKVDASFTESLDVYKAMLVQEYIVL